MSINIAILGARGIPARYSGYDTLVEELSMGLANSADFNVLVYCRSLYYNKFPKTLHGVRLVYIPAPRIKAIESLLHSFLSAINVLWQDIDVIYFVDPANAPFCVLLRMFGKKVIVHTDGLGWKRKKWGTLARRYYKIVEWICTRTANALVTDNLVMRDYYRTEYGAESFYIPYGAKQHSGVDNYVYKEIGLSPKRYLLVVSRLEPENNTDLIIQEYVESKVKMPLVVVGDSPYDDSYFKRLHDLSNERVQFLGRINNQSKLNALYKGAYLYIHGHEVGGTNPSLLRAMDAGSTPLIIDVAFNTAVINGCGYVFQKKKGSLSKMLNMLNNNASDVMMVGVKAKEHVEKNFRWDAVVKDHAKLFHYVVNNEN